MACLMAAELQHSDLAVQLMAGLKLRGWKSTSALRNFVCLLCSQKHPLTIDQMTRLPGMETYHRVTVYRLVMRLEHEGLIRSISFAGRARRFILDGLCTALGYALCSKCNTLHELNAAPLLMKSCDENALAGWTNLRTELLYFGICPACVLCESRG